MTQTPDHHAPDPEFAEYLARDIVRTLRHDARFAPSPAAIRARRVNLILASAAGTVLVLAAGLVFGTSTGYASAQAESARQRSETVATAMGAASQLDELRMDLGRARADLARLASGPNSVPQDSLRNAESELKAMEASASRIKADLTQAALAVQPAPVQQAVPTVTLPPASARTAIALWSVGGIRQLPGGKLLVNDDVAREVRLFDSTLAGSAVTIDSNSYGPRRPRSIPLIRFTGDSSLLPESQAHTLRVLDAQGQVARTIALPPASANLAGPGYVDDKGRLLYTALPVWRSPSGGPDSASVVRLDLASGRIDTVGHFKSTNRAVNLRVERGDSAVNRGFNWVSFSDINARPIVPSRDDWAVLSDGSIAFVRGHDYHIDWLRPDGAASSTAKLPFDWQRLADETNRQPGDSAYVNRLAQRLNDTVRWDSTKRQVLKLYQSVASTVYNLTLMQGNADAMIPDLDGNLWILPSGPAPRATSEVMYDVVNAKGELVQRVRVPAGKSVAGFGKDGVVYLVSGNRQAGYYIERTRIIGSIR